MSAFLVPDIQNTFGAAFIGLLISTTLFGLAIVQTWIYFWRYWKKDPKALKFFIAFITVMDTLHTILCAYVVYWYLVLNFGNVESLGYSMWAMNIQVVTSIFVGASVQLYYARRVYLVSQSIFIPILIVALVVVGSSFGIVFTAKEWVHSQAIRPFSFLDLDSVHRNDYKRCGGLVDRRDDVLVSLPQEDRLREASPTDSIIMTLMAYSINSGFLTSILTVAMTISFVVSPSSLVWLPFFWAMSKCYVNSLLAMLNSRDHIRDRSTADNPDNAFNLTSIRIEPPSETYGSKSSQPGVSVTIQRSTTSDFGLNKSDHGVEPTFEVPKQDASITHFQSQGRTSESST
ncbi:hypothetical protein EDB85DRAFT_2140687 [Lactarius pseudohatsudake]|nr:hypothetical protein EDB85DRAFT_2140687 [Lactarius pseudohatsudake]